ncbi:hypothetical protein [Poseidonocella sp. HB161398]|uniref:hypothetical protein n=1 Tax=Poseidonocella sp. HB161398 TaxID=2320855 RepID=UPI001109434B|nr:hypothetical protein [Poseidonocella sp. HB161398]
MTTFAKLAAPAACLLVPALPLAAQTSYQTCITPGWLEKSDADFAAACADLAFNGSLEERQRLAWMFFARVNRLLDAPEGNDGMTPSGKVPLWMAWPTDPDTFHSARPFDFGAPPRTDMEPSAEKKDIVAGRVTTADPDGANEEVTRNQISYDYLIAKGLTTKLDVAAYFEDHDYVDMPVGTIELKASWLQVADGSPAPEGALTYDFDSGTYWWRGLHIMVKMAPLPDPGDTFYSEDPSWFWTTFEFNANPGVAHVRETLITQRAPLPGGQIAEILAAAGLGGEGFDRYAPNGTQIRFTENGTGAVPVVLGHTDMEDFAGGPNTAQPQYWTGFQASCHACHATAAYNPASGSFFPFSVPVGALHPGYNVADKAGIVQYLGQGFKPLDFMWPIAFQAR